MEKKKKKGESSTNHNTGNGQLKSVPVLWLNLAQPNLKEKIHIQLIFTSLFGIYPQMCTQTNKKKKKLLLGLIKLMVCIVTVGLNPFPGCMFKRNGFNKYTDTVEELI